MIVVPNVREGSQDLAFDKNRTGISIHSNPLLKTRHPKYNLRLNSNSNHQTKRFISSQPLANIDIYKKAYDIMKSNPGNMTPGSNKITLDAMSLTKLMNLKNQVLS